MNLLNWYHASGFNEAKLNMPLLETTLVFVLLTVCLLFRMSRTGLIIAYLFFYRACWMMLQNIIKGFDASSKTFAVTAYIVFGVLVVTFAIIGMLQSSRSDN